MERYLHSETGMEAASMSTRKILGAFALGSILLGVMVMNMHDIVRYVRITRM